MSDTRKSCDCGGDADCNCLAYLATMGEIDEVIEDRLTNDPTFGPLLIRKIRNGELGTLA